MMIKKIVSVFLILFVFKFGYSQPEKSENYSVGFKYFTSIDKNRIYIIDEDTVNRPMLIHFWYPCKTKSNQNYMSFKEYIDLIAIRENFKKEQQEITNASEGFVNAYLSFSKRKFGIDTMITTSDVLNSFVNAIHNAKPVKGKFPLIIYAPSNSKSSVQNHIMCEYLASRGYYVISVGSAGSETLKRKDEIKATLAQVDDIEFLVDFVNDSLKINISNIGLLGYSSGSLATVIYQMKNPDVKAVVSLDGAQEYSSYLNLCKIDDFDLNKADIPYLVFANNYKDFSVYPYYSSISSANKYMYKMPFLDHNGFISYWKQFDMCSRENSPNKLSESYDILCKQVNLFFDATLKSNQLVIDGFEIENTQLIQKDTVNYSIMTNLLNKILKNGIDNSVYEVKQNENIYKTKDKMFNILARMFIGTDNQTAIKIFILNTEINPNSWESYYNLAYLYKENNEIFQAKEAIKKAIDLNNTNSDIKTLYDEIIRINNE